MNEKSNTNDSIDSVYGATRSPSANEDNGDENEEDEISLTLPLPDDASSSSDSDEESDASSASSMKKIKGKYAEEGKNDDSKDEEGKNDDSKDEEESSIESVPQFPTLFSRLHEFEPQYLQFINEDGQVELCRRRRIYEADKVKLKPRENPEELVKYLKLSQMCQQEIMLEYYENERKFKQEEEEEDDVPEMLMDLYHNRCDKKKEVKEEDPQQRKFNFLLFISFNFTNSKFTHLFLFFSISNNSRDQKSCRKLCSKSPKEGLSHHSFPKWSSSAYEASQKGDPYFFSHIKEKKEERTCEKGKKGEGSD